MFKISAHSLFLAIALQFVVVSGVYAFGVDQHQDWNDSAVETVRSTQFDTYQYSQNGRANLRSRSDVIQEVKRRYNAEVLKITLDERQQVYRVRVLMPNGKVRNLQISARR